MLPEKLMYHFMDSSQLMCLLLRGKAGPCLLVLKRMFSVAEVDSHLTCKLCLAMPNETDGQKQSLSQGLG